MGKKVKVAVLFGGRSGEHEVSLSSATAVMKALDNSKYDIIPVGITREGTWLAGGDPMSYLQGGCEDDCFPVMLHKGRLFPLLPEKGEIIPVDIVFPVLHGPYGEDGTLQGLLEIAGIPYVGCGVTASAVGMDKVIMKQVFVAAGIPIGPYLHFKEYQWRQQRESLLDQVENELDYPCFVKPANLGSSVGISKAHNRRELAQGIEEAFNYDLKIVVEGALTGREVECSVLGNDQPRASIPGEIRPCNEFYDYRAKYIDDRSELIIPAPLSPALSQEVQRLAVAAFRAVDGSGLSRVDFFVDEGKNAVYVNEVNTMPGFTSISMYPKLWEQSGLSYPELLDSLIGLGMERFQRRQALSVAPPPELR